MKDEHRQSIEKAEKDHARRVTTWHRTLEDVREHEADAALAEALELWIDEAIRRSARELAEIPGKKTHTDKHGRVWRRGMWTWRHASLSVSEKSMPGGPWKWCMSTAAGPQKPPVYYATAEDAMDASGGEG